MRTGEAEEKRERARGKEKKKKRSVFYCAEGKKKKEGNQVAASTLLQFVPKGAFDLRQMGKKKRKEKNPAALLP